MPRERKETLIQKKKKKKTAKKKNTGLSDLNVIHKESGAVWQKLLRH